MKDYKLINLKSQIKTENTKTHTRKHKQLGQSRLSKTTKLIITNN